MLPTAAQVSADRKRIDAGAARDLAHWAVGVVVQHDHRPLLWRESLERGQQLLVGMGVVNGALGHRPMPEARLALEITPGQVEGGAPDPAAHISDRRAPTQRLGKGLGDRIGRDLLVAGEGVQRPPQSIAVLTVYRLNLAGRLNVSHDGRHYALTGSDRRQKVTAGAVIEAGGYLQPLCNRAYCRQICTPGPLGAVETAAAPQEGVDRQGFVLSCIDP
jgi:hypothetical protein